MTDKSLEEVSITVKTLQDQHQIWTELEKHIEVCSIFCFCDKPIIVSFSVVAVIIELQLRTAVLSCQVLRHLHTEQHRY